MGASNFESAFNVSGEGRNSTFLTIAKRVPTKWIDPFGRASGDKVPLAV